MTSHRGGGNLAGVLLSNASSDPAMPDKTSRPAPHTVACPQCGTPVEWSARSPFRPFCSERCKLIDLGAWAAERYRVPDEEPPLDDDR